MPLEFQKCFALFQTKRTNSYIICSYQQQMILNNCLFIKLGVRIKKLFQPTATEQSYLKHYYHEQEKELPADHPYFFSVGFSTSCNGNRQSTQTSNRTQVHN